jgi:isopenicillin N synthase-like dioxygenase
METLPIIDISPLYQNDRAAWKRVADQIDEACCTWGFFYIKGHPIAESRIEELLAAGQSFFKLPLEEKLKMISPRASAIQGTALLLPSSWIRASRAITRKPLT